ncbi:hypothetical protein U0035_20495 [Niabella yanshanensis]|uniref:Uncharacterized protein n=1 Tax=Niabella yanshanensis TaxID=577386 RepID=A0ABZ0W7Q7_9BACT|nr:hypothetical protein [Niabella yanshanensis]WQD38050.1 hypothetical protein U0035_20495 [Niabella yanshanensis]
MRLFYSIILSTLFLCPVELHAMPTKITIRVKAKDAKFIGTAIGGAAVIVRDNLSGSILSQGVTAGGSGDTKIIMQTPLTRYQPQTDSTTAKYVAVVDVEEPTLVDVEVQAPLSRRGAAIKGTTQLWVIPGKDILGDGIIIELPGLILDILNPYTHQSLSEESFKNGVFVFRVNLVMLCGCPIATGGVWDANNFEVKAYLKKDGKVIGNYELNKTDVVNLYEGKLPSPVKGSYELTVHAFQNKGYNAGADRINFTVQ